MYKNCHKLLKTSAYSQILARMKYHCKVPTDKK